MRPFVEMMETGVAIGLQGPAEVIPILSTRSVRRAGLLETSLRKERIGVAGKRTLGEQIPFSGILGWEAKVKIKAFWGKLRISVPRSRWNLS